MTLDDEKRSRLQASHAEDPIACPWGVITTDPWPSGLQIFHWYGSAAALSESLLSGDHAIESSPEEWLPIGEALAAVLAVPEPFVTARVDEGNRAAYPGFNILWWGTFDDLCVGDSEKAVEIREDFFTMTEEEYEPDGSPRPVAEEEVASFVEFLKEWGF